MSSRLIKRHTTAGIFIHWFNAVFWFFLFFTGLALIDNPQLMVLGQGYSNTLRALFGGGGGLLNAHVGAGMVWAGVWVVFLLAGLTKFTIPFLRQIFTLKPSRDIPWMIKKNFQMTMGYAGMAKMVEPLGWDASIPEQEYYNAGQKVAAQVMVAGALLLTVTGLIMAASKYFLEPDQVIFVQWSILLHFIAAGITFAVLLVHIYMAAVATDERPAFISMFTGTVPAEYAEHHHRLWYEQLQKAEETPDGASA